MLLTDSLFQPCIMRTYVPIFMVIEQMFDGGGRMHEKKTGRKIDREFIGFTLISG